MGSSSVSAGSYGYYNPYAYSSIETPYYGSFRNFGNYRNFSTTKPQSQKTGFWEGVCAFGKGLVRPIVNMIKHPVKTALFTAGAAALVIATGGVATPFLIGAGLMYGGYQVVKNSYNAITAKTREETLAALENLGEGTFTLAASVAGAKSYASGTSAGSATAAAAKESGKFAKFCTYTKGLGKDSLTVLREVPTSARTTLTMLKSGEAAVNLQSYAGSAQLAAQHRSLARTRLEHGTDSLKYNLQKQVYDSNLRKFNASMDKTSSAVAKNYGKVLDTMEAAGQKGTPQYDFIQDRLIDVCDNKFVSSGNIRAIKKNLNIFRNLPEENIGLACASRFGNDNEDEFVRQAQQYVSVLI